MPFRIPVNCRNLSVSGHDVDQAHGGDIDDYIRWLEKELATALAHKKAMEREAKKNKKEVEPVKE